PLHRPRGPPRPSSPGGPGTGPLAPRVPPCPPPSPGARARRPPALSGCAVTAAAGAGRRRRTTPAGEAGLSPGRTAVPPGRHGMFHLKCTFSGEVSPAGLVRHGGGLPEAAAGQGSGLGLGAGRRVALPLESVDLGPADKEPGCIDSSHGVVVARRGLKSVHGRVILPDRDDNAVSAAAPEQVPFEPSVSTEHRQRLLRGEALVCCGSCLSYL